MWWYGFRVGYSAFLLREIMMYTNWMIRATSCVAVSLVAVAFAGCSKEAGKPAPAPAPSVAADDPAVEAILAKADLVDGTADHRVSKCAGCALGMDGDPKHALKAGKYKLHFCSGPCKDTFAKDTNKSVLALNIP